MMAAALKRLGFRWILTYNLSPRSSSASSFSLPSSPTGSLKPFSSVATAAAAATPNILPDFSSARVDLDVRAAINRCAAIPARGITLKDLYTIATTGDTESALRVSAKWLAAELPVRLARRVRDLESLDAINGLGHSRGILAVHDMYVDSFRDVVNARAQAAKGDIKGFASVLEGVKERHKDVVATMAQGIFEWKAGTGKSKEEFSEQVKGFLNRFYMTRIGIRVLIGHFLELGTRREGYAGVINMKCRPAEVAKNAGSFAKHLAYAHFGESPEIHILGDENLEFPYIEGHMYLCLFELLKNSLRATFETHRDEAVLPPVKVIIADGTEDITIKISDEGGGIPRSGMDKIWTYMYTTANTPPEQLLDMEHSNKRTRNRPDPIAGFGFGIPLTATYARYFGGELTIIGMDGYGTDAYLHLCKLGNKKEHVV